MPARKEGSVATDLHMFSIVLVYIYIYYIIYTICVRICVYVGTIMLISLNLFW